MVKKKSSNFRGKVAGDAQRQQKAATSYGHLSLPRGVNVFSPEPGGRVKLDFLPYEVTDPKHSDRNPEAEVAMPGTLWYKHPYKLHRNVGVENDAAVCLSSIGKKCPICEYRAKQIKAGADREDTDAIKPSLRNLYIVVPLDSKKHEEKPHIFDISQYNFQIMLNDELEEHEEYEVFPDIEEGLTLKIRFASKTIGKGQPFAQASRIDFLEREETYDESILEKVPNLDEVLIILSYDELHAKFFDMEDEEEGGKLSSADDDEEEEEDEKPIRKKKTIPPKRQSHQEEEEEDDRPAKRKVRKKEVEEEEEEEEEEDEKPTRSSKRSTSERSSGKKNKCPHGHKFGEDHEEYDECDDCKSWDGCLEEKEK